MSRHEKWDHPSRYVCYRCQLGPCDVWINDKQGIKGTFPRVLDSNDEKYGDCPYENTTVE